MLMDAMRLHFDICPAEIDERPRDDESPQELVARLSGDKARKVAARNPKAIVVAADTVVVHQGRVLGKPVDAREATEMLLQLRGRQHDVFTGLTVLADGQEIAFVVRTPVQLRLVSRKEITDYVASGFPMDKAGAYAIQDGDFAPVANIGNCYANVIGLPICHLHHALTSLGLYVPTHPLDSCPWPLTHGGCRWAVHLFKELEIRPGG